MPSPAHAALALGLLLSTPAISLAQSRHHVEPRASAEPTGPVVVLDTSSGRLTCLLFTTQAPRTTANFIALAEGTRDWTDGSGATQHNKPFFDGTQVFGITDGISAGDRTASGMGTAGPTTSPEKTGLDLDRSGQLVALVTNGQQSPSNFAVLTDPDLEYAKRAVVFGQCDEASIATARTISHDLLSTDNHPTHPVVLRSVRIVPEGQPLPPITPASPGEASLTVPPAPAPAVTPPDPTGPTALIDTTHGTLTCRLFSKEAPIAVANFIGLAQGTKPFRSPATHALVHGKHFYDGLHFNRVIPDFMIQNADMPGDPEGGGDIGIHFANEVVPGLTFDRPGRLAYANSGPNTNASEFFITEHPNRRLDGSYTIFGQCDDASVKVVASIARLPRDAHNKPLTPVVIRRITIQPAS